MREKRKGSPNVLGALAHYLIAVSFAFIFALFCSGRVGWFLVLMLLLAPAGSFLIGFLMHKGITCEAHQDGDVLNKGENCKIVVQLKNKWFLPTPPIRVEFLGCPEIICREPVCYLSVLPFQTAAVETAFTARMSGASFIGIRSIKVCDYTGIFQFPIDVTEAIEQKRQAPFQWKVGVVPEITEITNEGDYIRSISQAAIGSEENEDTLDSVSYSFGGFPGYEHRSYQPGDPIKRINWKLSSGKEELFVRMDEVKAGTEVSIVLDPCLHTKELTGCQNRAERSYEKLKGEELTAALKQDTLEMSLGFARILIQKDLTVRFLLWEEDNWTSFQIVDEEGINKVAAALAYTYFRDSDTPERVPKELIAVKCSAMLYVTPFLDDALAETLRTYGGREDFAAAVYVTFSEGGSVL